MDIRVQFFSYCQELTGCAATQLAVPPGATLGDLVAEVMRKFPRLASMERSLLVAVGVEYRMRDHRLAEGDEVSLFPPVQGG